MLFWRVHYNGMSISENGTLVILEYGGCLISLCKMVASLFLILDVLYIGQHLRSRGITEIRTPMAPPQKEARVAGVTQPP